VAPRGHEVLRVGRERRGWPAAKQDRPPAEQRFGLLAGSDSFPHRGAM